MSAPLFNLNNLTGATLLGVILSAILYGITLLQVYLYYDDRHHEDRTFLKSLVAFMLTLDTVHLALIIHTVYWYTIVNYDDPETLDTLVWSLILQIAVAYTLSATTQSYYAWRVYVVSFRTNWWIPLFIIIVALGSTASAFAFVVFTFLSPSLTKYDAPAVLLVTLSFGLELCADVMVMLSTIFYLQKGRQDAFPEFRSNRILAKLISYAATTGIPINVFTIVTTTLYLRDQNSLLYTPFFFVLVRLYSCSFMTMLNSRKTIRETMSGQSSSDIGAGSALPLGTLAGPRISGIHLVVERETAGYRAGPSLDQDRKV